MNFIHPMKQSLQVALISSVSTALVLSIAVAASVFAAPTQAPPNGNPSFPLQGQPGPTGPAGPAGAQGQQGPAGTWAPGQCQVCVRICDFNGAGPCATSCGTEGQGYGSVSTLPGDVDGNDQMRVSFDCW